MLLSTKNNEKIILSVYLECIHKITHKTKNEKYHARTGYS